MNHFQGVEQIYLFDRDPLLVHLLLRFMPKLKSVVIRCDINLHQPLLTLPEHPCVKPDLKHLIFMVDVFNANHTTHTFHHWTFRDEPSLLDQFVLTHRLRWFPWDSKKLYPQVERMKEFSLGLEVWDQLVRANNRSLYELIVNKVQSGETIHDSPHTRGKLLLLPQTGEFVVGSTRFKDIMIQLASDRLIQGVYPFEVWPSSIDTHTFLRLLDLGVCPFLHGQPTAQLNELLDRNIMQRMGRDRSKAINRVAQIVWSVIDRKYTLDNLGFDTWLWQQLLAYPPTDPQQRLLLIRSLRIHPHYWQLLIGAMRTHQSSKAPLDSLSSIHWRFRELIHQATMQ